MPQPRWDVRKAALVLVQTGAHGLNVRGAYPSPIEERGAHAAAIRELRERFDVEGATASSALSWAFAEERGDKRHATRAPGKTSGTAPNTHLVLTPAELAYCAANGGKSATIHEALRRMMAQEA